MKPARHAAEFGFLFHQHHLKSLASEPRAAFIPAMPPPITRARLLTGMHLLLQRFQVRRAGHRHPHQVLGLFGGGFRVLGVDPGILVADVGHFKQVFVQPAGLQGFHEHRFVGLGAAGGHDHPVELVLLDFFLDFLLGVLAAGEEILIREDHVGQPFGISLDGRHIDHAADVDAAVADKYTDARLLTGDIPTQRDLDSCGHPCPGLRPGRRRRHRRRRWLR